MASLIIADLLANAELDLFQAFGGTAPTLKGWSGAVVDIPTDPGTLLFSIVLPTTWMSPAAARSKALSGSWLTTVGVAAGTIASCGLYAGAGGSVAAGTPFARGKAGLTGDGTAFFTFPSLNTAVGLAVQINSFTLTR